MTYPLRFTLSAALVALCACSSSSKQDSLKLAADASPEPDAQVVLADSGARYPLSVKIAIAEDAGTGAASFATQNGSQVQIPKAQLAGRPFFWIVIAGGEPVTAAKPIETGSGVLGADLTASFFTDAQYRNGPWELALWVASAGIDSSKGPQPGDIAAFDLSPPPAGDPPVTGTSVRVKVADDAPVVTLANRNFIRF